MPNIATQMVDGERIVVTKVVEDERRVSCSCCATDCCMYPAAMLGVQYNEEDLPDSLEFFIDNFGTLDEWPRSGATFTNTYTGDDGPYSAEIAIETMGESTGWTFRGVGGSGGYVVSCLFFSGELGATDLFADTYTITTNQATGVVTRQSLCVWTGVDDLGCPLELRYEDRAAPPRAGSQYKWTVDFAEGGLSPCDERAIAIKTPYQNTPVGSYDYAGVSVA